jgi:hypothetical protein
MAARLHTSDVEARVVQDAERDRVMRELEIPAAWAPRVFSGSTWFRDDTPGQTSVREAQSKYRCVYDGIRIHPDEIRLFCADPADLRDRIAEGGVSLADVSVDRPPRLRPIGDADVEALSLVSFPWFATDERPPNVYQAWRVGFSFLERYPELYVEVNWRPWWLFPKAGFFDLTSDPTDGAVIALLKAARTLVGQVSKPGRRNGQGTALGSVKATRAQAEEMHRLARDGWTPKSIGLRFGGLSERTVKRRIAGLESGKWDDLAS